MKISLFLILVFSFSAQASPPPCTVWQIKVRTHPVKKYKREDGTEYSRTTREEHCRDKFPTVTRWQDRFLDKAPLGWPEIGEKFKPWSQAEKEIVMQSLSIQPKALKKLNVQILRGVRSRSPKNPGTTVKKFDSIALYDDFFESQEQVRILSHELSHLYLHDLDKTKLSVLVSELGWRRNTKEDSLLRLNYPLLKSDSAQNLTEDIANHLEDFLHERENLHKKFPLRYELIRNLVPVDFQMEKP